MLANSETYTTDFSTELYRVMAHGILHLLGYDDLTPEQSQEMRVGEEEALAILREARVPFDQSYKSDVQDGKQI